MILIQLRERPDLRFCRAGVILDPDIVAVLSCGDRHPRLAKEGQMNVALVLVSLGLANAPEPVRPLMLAYFDYMTSCVAAAKLAELPVAGTPGLSLNTWAQFVCVSVPTKGMLR